MPAGDSDETPRGKEERWGYPDAAMAQGADPTSQDFDPLEMMRSAADLVNPVAAFSHHAGAV
jgi:hypothetical protein